MKEQSNMVMEDPKHNVTTYHVFVDRIKNGKVLDIGCGNGSVALDIASQRPKSHIIGIDISSKNIELANIFKKKSYLGNIKFIYGDINTQKI